jgi:microcystin-dependent protein
MGGATSPGLLASIGAGLKAVLNGLFGTNQKTLATANLPSYTPSGSISNGAITISHNASNNSPGAVSDVTPGSVQGSYGPATISASQGASTFSGNNNGGTSTPFDLVQPSRAVNFIIRIA